MKKFTALFLVFSLLVLSRNLYAQKKGVGLIVVKKDSQLVNHGLRNTPWEKWVGILKGELIAVKESSFLLLDRDSGADVTVDIGDVREIKIVKKSNALQGGVFGVLISLGGGAALLYSKDDVLVSMEGLLAGGIALGIIGYFIGASIGSSSGTDEVIQIEGKSDAEIQEILEKLRKKARIRNYL